MKTILRISTALMVLVFCGCSISEQPGKIRFVTLDSYITGLRDCSEGFAIFPRGGFKADAEGMILDRRESELLNRPGGYTVEDGVCLMISMGGRLITGEASDKRKEVYDGVVNALNDHGFGLRVANFETRSWALLLPVENLEITTDRQYLASVPAGDAVNSAFDVFYNDVVGIITNRYEPLPGSYKYFEKTLFPFSFIRTRADRLDYGRMNHIGDHIYLLLQSNPASTGYYKFTVRITFGDGSEYSVTTDPIYLRSS